MKKHGVVALLVVALALGACEFAGSALAPSVTGRAPGTSAPPAIVPLDVSRLGTPSGTSAGARITRFRAELAQLQHAAVEQLRRGRQLQGDMDANTSGYQNTVGTMTSGQQDGTAPADTGGAWQHAREQLRAISATLDQMNGLSGEVAKNVTYAAYLLQSIRAAGTAPDAVEEDHRQLQVLEEATAQTATSLDRLLGGLRQEVQRKSHFLGTEGAKLAQMAPAAGVPAADVGISPQPPATQPAPQPALQSAPPAGPAGAGLASGQPFVVIPFHDPAVAYEQQLYEAVNAALARSPNVAFDLVAVAPASGTPEEATLDAETARANADRVMRSLLDMGLPADRISMTQITDPDVQGGEVRLYVR